MRAKGKKTDKKSLDLTKTQVLNFNEVEQIANYEKKTSKKPAIIVAIVGIVAIMSGLLYPSINSMFNKKDEVDTSNKFREDSQVVSISDSLNCTKTSTNKEEYTTSVTTFDLEFNQEKLSSYEKVINITSTAPTLTETPNSMIQLNRLVDPLVQNPLEGYTLYKSMQTDQTNPSLVNSYTVKLVVDLEKFFISSLSEEYKENDFLNVIYTKDNHFTDIRKSLIDSGYTCN